MKLDVYDEFVIYRTRYTNDAADRLTKVVDALGNTTSITYDALGRKVGMNDPDMGIWAYAYNPLGQLISQTDALGQTQWFGYDGLGRMTEKRVGGPSGALLASYLYDQGNNGIGRRSAMTDTTGYTAWFYDVRGQVTMTQKQIAPNPAAYVTKFGYDDANRVITVSYPGGDVVTNTFDLAGQPNSLYAAGSALVKSATYNALGAPTRVSFGNGLDKVNQYFGLDVPAGGAWGPLFAYGKLRNTCVITSAQACDSEVMGALLNTVYWYDKAGNVTTVRDNVLNSKVDARYDALNRLVVVSSTNYITGVAQMAPMSETYSYNAIGNLTGRFGVGGTGAITYPAAGSARPHAATGAGLNAYVYDSNGNMTVRREMSGTETFVYTQTWSIDNRLIGVTKALTSGAVLAQTSYFFDGDGVRVRKDDPDGTTLYAGPVEQTIGPGGTATAEYFDDISGTSTLTAFVATRNETVTAGFQQTFTVPPAGLGSEPYGVRYQIWLMVPTTDTYRLAVYADDGFLLSGQGLSLSNATTRDVTTTEASTVLTLTPGAIYNFALTYLNYTSATTSALQVLWRRGGGALEVVPKESIRARGRRDYYSFGGAVVAMKDGVMNAAPRTLSYLHGDHLGSASLTTNASGQKVSEQRYKPYGEVRWSSGAGMPTDRQFTSQTRLTEGYVGTLYDYVARAYDPVLGRFISPDTIVPGAGSSQALNRYSYVRNSPLRFLDPSGHVEANPDLGGCGAACYPPPTVVAVGAPTPPSGAPLVGTPNPFAAPSPTAQSTPNLSPPRPVGTFLWMGVEHTYYRDTFWGGILDGVDRALYVYAPTTIGIQIGSAQAQTVQGIAGGGIGINDVLAFNVRSGELGHLTSGGAFACLCAGEAMAGNGGVANGIFVGYGATTLDRFVGSSHAVTVFGTAALELGLSADLTLSASAKGPNDWRLLTDPVSGRFVQSGLLSLSFSTGFAAAGGVSYSWPNVNDTVFTPLN